MTTETFSLPSYTAGADVYVRFYNAAKLVFDFADDTFKALASCTTPYKVCTEKADGDGTGFSDWIVTQDLALLNDLPTIARFSAKFFDNGTPADTDVAVSDPLDFTVQAGDIGERAVIAQADLNVKSTAGTAAQVAAFLEIEGVIVDPVGVGGTAFTADAGTDVCTSVAHGLLDGDSLVVVNSGGGLPTGLAAGTVYYVRDKTDDTFKLANSSGGAAIDITGAGTGVHKCRNPTASVTFREHDSAANLFTISMKVEDLPNDGATPKVLTGAETFEKEQSNPNFTNDRGYDVTVAITIDGNTWTSHLRNVVIG